jgi:hypothetical protein
MLDNVVNPESIMTVQFLRNASLGHDFVREAGMSQWVPVIVEEPLG